MKPFAHRLSFVLCVLLLVSAAEAINYLWLTDHERTTFGDVIKFSAADSLSGVIRSNDTIAFMPQGYVPPCDLIIYADVFGIEPNPECPGNIHPNPPHYQFSEVAQSLRQMASAQGHYFAPAPDAQARVRIDGSQLLVWWGTTGMPVDTSVAPDTVAFSGIAHGIFFECPFSVWGVLDSALILGSSGRIGLEDNILYASSDPITGALAPNHVERFALISENEIKILNTPANGRENSNGLGNEQGDPALTSIALNGFYVALHESFTFDQQNDPDSGYVCTCAPDYRGTIYLWGGITQRRRGYMHRSNLGSTGYDKQLRGDPVLANWNFYSLVPPHESTDTLNFGDVVIGQTVTDTAHIYVGDYSTLGAAMASAPFVATPTIPSFGTHFAIPVHFTPPSSLNYSGHLQVTTSFNYFDIALRGRGVVPNSADPAFIVPPSSFIVSVSPNPFNETTTLSFVLEAPGTVKADLYNIFGRHVAALLDRPAGAGVQQLIVDGRTLASGVYFVRLVTPSRQHTLKLLLLK